MSMHCLRISLITTLLLFSGSLTSAASPPPPPKGGNYTFSATPATSPLYAYWVAVAKGIKKAYPQFNITITEPTGALDSIKRVRTKQAAVGNCMAALDYASYMGEEQFAGQPSKKDRILWYHDYLIAQWGVIKSSGIKTIEGLDGKDFNPGGAGGGIVFMTKKTFAMWGVKPKYYEATQASAIEATLNRQIIGLSKAGPVPDSFFQQILANMPIEMVGLTREQQAKVVAKYNYWVPFTIPAKTYGDTQEVLTIGELDGGHTLSDLPEEVGYAFFKAMWEDGKPLWQAAYPSAANNNVIEMTLKSVVPLHAGTVRYLTEHGIKVPERLIPPEYKPVK